MTRYKPIAERFIEKCEISMEGCWTWSGAVNANGYASFWDGDKTETASRVAWRLFCGAIPDDLSVLHRCDNPRCVKPSHLFLGTHNDNMADKVLKGRAAKLAGELNPRAKLTAAAARAIRMSSESTSVLSQRHGINATTIQRIRAGKAWVHA